MKGMLEDTIAAISSPVGEGAIGIVRISGPEAVAIADELAADVKGRRPSQWEHASVHYCKIRDPRDGSFIDEALCFVMKAPRSYTREDLVELQCHGGTVPLLRVLEAAFRSGARPAEPGEFTKRAFLNGRIDLAQAESVIDVIRSRTDTALRAALGQLGGRLSSKVRAIRGALMDTAAWVEALLDFPEDDIPEAGSEDLLERLNRSLGDIESLAGTADAGIVLREGVNTVIVGRPNVGKSSLLNTLVGEERAIVTEIPGTTRDVIQEVINIRGIPLKLTDTAGIRETQDLIERMGVAKTKQVIERADLILLVVDSSSELMESDLELMEELVGRTVVVVLNKSDLPRRVSEESIKAVLPEARIVSTCLITGSGVDELERVIEDAVLKGSSAAGDVIVTRARHKQLLEAASENLRRAIDGLRSELPLDLVAMEIREAAEHLGEITGESYSTDVIDRIFADFCIGK